MNTIINNKIKLFIVIAILVLLVSASSFFLLNTIEEDIDCFNSNNIGLVGNSGVCKGLLVVDREMLYQKILREGGVEVGGVLYTASLPNGVFTGQIQDFSSSSGDGFVPNNFNEDISYWDMSSATNMSSFFSNAALFNQPLDSWDVSNVENMSMMFFNATSFNQPLGNWDVSNVRDMVFMFEDAILFNQPLDNWDMSSVHDISGMFSFATSFNQPLNNWDVSNVIEMYGVFFGATSFNQPLNNWDVSNVEFFDYMFEDAVSFNQDLTRWNVNSAIDCTGFDLNTQSWENNLKPQFLISCEEGLFWN